MPRVKLQGGLPAREGFRSFACPLALSGSAMPQPRQAMRWPDNFQCDRSETLTDLENSLLALAASWALAVFKLVYSPSLLPSAAAGLIVTALTVTVGLLTSYGVGSTPPLAILREELD